VPDDAVGAAPPTLHAARLVLRPFVPADAPDVARLAGAREVAAGTLTVPHPYPEPAAVAWIAGHAGAWADGSRVTYALTLRDGGALVGAAGLAITAAHRRAELGYWVGVPYWGRGYCTEASGALLAFAFGPLALHRVEAHHFTRNPASGRVMQKLGMRLEGVHRGAVLKDGRFEDLAHYAVLADDPPAPGA
jgi:RimJ/RimL family protein N-acetyltransferase